MRRRSFLRHTLLLTAVHLLLRTSGLLFHIWLSRRIGAAGMGRLQLILTASGFALTLGISGSRAACMNLVAAQRGLGRPAAMKQAIVSSLQYCLFFSCIAGIALFFGADLLAERWIRDTNAIPALRLTGLCVPLHCAVAVLYGCFTARGRIRPLVLTELLEQAVDILATLAALQLWAGADFSRITTCVIGGSAIGALCSLSILGVQLLRDLHPIPGRQCSMLRPLLRLTVPLALSDYLRSGLDTAEQFLIPHGLSRSGGSYDRSIADYGTICGMVFPVLMFPSVLFLSLSDLLLPELSGSRARGEDCRIRSVCTSCLQCGTVFSAVIAGLLFLIGPQLGQLLYRSASAGAYLRAFSPLVLFLYTDRLVDGMLKGLGEQVACVRYNTVTSFLDVALLLLLLPRLGVTGFFLTFTLTHLLNFGLSLRRLCQTAKIAPDFRHAARTVAAVAPATAFCLLLPRESPAALAIAALLYCALSLCLCLLTDALHPDTLAQFFPKKKTAGVFSRRKATI